MTWRQAISEMIAQAVDQIFSYFHPEHWKHLLEKNFFLGRDGDV